ncbi:MAG TPA: heavy metal translocating P-type ATPase [Clostridiales bacterium]|jgi:Cd2+/Zn2+-exporting ATPase|nr:heavy metal translocating P-type ATPase [Clostridiales bacterium]
MVDIHKINKNAAGKPDGNSPHIDDRDHDHNHGGDDDLCEIGRCGCCEESHTQLKTQIAIPAVTAALFAAALSVTRAFSLPEWGKALIFAFPYLICGGNVLINCVKNILRGRFFEPETLMTVATLGAFAVGEYPEAAAVMWLFRLGELLEGLASDRARKSIKALVDIRPDEAEVESGGRTERVRADSVEVGAVIVVRAGARAPLDGEVIEGETELDTSALTGEAIPRAAGPGDIVYSGSVNLLSPVRVRVTKPAGESAASRILALVRESLSAKSKALSFTERFSHVYTPAVVASAALISLIPPLISGDFAANFGKWFYRALEFLVVSCPCAFVISVPLTFVAGLGAASKAGVLIKGSNYLELLAKADTVVFDKTGTLTTGSFSVTEIKAAEGISENELLREAAAAESFSDHPIAVSLRRAYLERTADEKISSGDAGFARAETANGGILAEIGGKTIVCGNSSLLIRSGVAEAGLFNDSEAPTSVHAARIDEKGVKYLGVILLSDELKPGAAKAVADLRRLGIKRTVILTGDSKRAGEAAARSVGADLVYSELLPEDKVSRVGEITEKMNRGSLVFVGDGINDAPVIARADVGAAMGGLGSDAAVESADVVIMDDNPEKLAAGIRIARRTMRIVRTNVALALGFKLLVLILCGIGLGSMWLAVFGDVGVTLICIMNAAAAAAPGL